MKKKFFLGLGVALLGVIAFAAIHNKGKVTGNAVVNMTYVDADAPTTAFGEVTTAVGGYNKISGGTVAMANSGWGVNKIIYLNVDISGVKTDRMIKKVTLYAECSGSTDSKRTTGWGVGWNESDWSADMTYDTADKSIMLCGDVAWTSTKSSATYETLSWDISDAFARADPSVTILVYETAAAGGNFRNPYVVVEEEPLLFNTEAPTNVPAAVVTYLQGEGNTAPAGCQDIAYYDSTATVWKADQSKFGATFSNLLTTYGGTQVTLAKFDLSEYELPFDYEIESVSIGLHAQCTVSGKNSNIHGVLIPNTDIDLTKATWNNTNTAEVLGTMTDLGTIGNGNSSGVTMSKDITEIYNNAENKVFMFGFYTETGRNQDLSDIKLIVNIKPIIHETELSYFVAQAIEEAGDADVVYDLDPAIEYTLNTPVVTGTKKVTINGGGRTLVVDSIGQFRIKEDLVLNDINFDCAASPLPLIALDSMKVAADTAYCWNKYGANGKDAFFMENIKLNNVNVSGLTTSLIKSEAPWAIRNVSIMNSIVQMNQANKFITINLQEGGNGMIQNLDVEKSTIYNIVADKGVFIAYNANNPGKKFWGEEDGNSTWVMKNCTFANIYGDKMGDRYTEQKTNTITWTGNVFYSVGNLSKIRNCTVASTPADNTTAGTGCDNNKGYATVDTMLVLTIPESNLDLTNLDLASYFTPGSETYAAEEGFGDPRWKGTPANVFYSQDYEKVGVAVDWKTSVGGRFDPIIAVEDGNHYLCADPKTVNNNGAVMTSINEAHVAANTDYTMSVDLRLGSSSQDTATEFDLFDGANSSKLLSLRETGKNTTKWILNENTTDTLDLAGTECDAHVAGRPWYRFIVTMYNNVLFVSAINLETGDTLVNKKVFDHQSAEGGAGKMQFTTSRYNASFAIDNVLARKAKESDLPAGLELTNYTINYLYAGNPIKEARVANTFSGFEIKASNADLEAIYDKADETINMKYLYQSGADTLIADADASKNVINLVFRQANRVQYKLTGTWGATEKTINLIKKDSPLSWEGEKVLSYYPEFILDGDSLGYLGSGQQVTNQFTLEEVLPNENYVHKLPYTGGYTTLNQKTPGVIKNVVFFSEAEELPGFTKSEQVNQGIRCSSGYCAYNLEDQTLVTLEPGKYYVAAQFWGGTSSNQWEIGKIEIGSEVLSVSTTGSRGQAVKTFTVTESTPVVVKAIDQTTDYKNSGYDWILIQKLVETELVANDINMMAGDTLVAADYVTTNSTGALTYKSNNEEVVKVVDGNVIGVGAGSTTIIVSQAEADGYVAATDTMTVVVKEYAVLPALPANATYSWQSPRGTVEEVGGTAVASEADPTRVNYSQAPAYIQYYTICLNGKKDLSDNKYTTVTLDKALVAGDTIYVYAFKNKGEVKKSGVKFFWGAEGTSSVMACGDDFPDIYAGGEPVLVKYIVPADAAGQTVFRMTRAETATNLFIAQLAIVPQETPTGINEVKNSIFNGEGMYNVRGQKITKANKGDIIILNGKKYIAK